MLGTNGGGFFNAKPLLILFENRNRTDQLRADAQPGDLL